MSAAIILQYRSLVAKATPHNADMKTIRGVGDDGRPSPAEARRSWGEDSFLSPSSFPARASAPQSALARKSRNPRHLGASSPSGNVRGECRGWTPLDHEHKNDRMNEAQYRGLGFEFRQLPFLKGSPPEAPSPIHF